MPRAVKIKAYETIVRTLVLYALQTQIMTKKITFLKKIGRTVEGIRRRCTEVIDLFKKRKILQTVKTQRPTQLEQIT